MYHSITFGSGQTSKNTWSDWKLVPESPPVIAAPRVKTNYVDIPGRLSGPLDMTEVPFGGPMYERITGNFLFVMYDDYWYTPNPRTVYENVRGWLHGRTCPIVLEDDSSHYYYGRFSVAPPTLGQGPFAIQISYDLEPLRHNVSNDSVDTTWLPNLS